MILCGCYMSLDARMLKEDNISEWDQERAVSLYWRWPSHWILLLVSHNMLFILIRTLLLAKNRNTLKLTQVKRTLLQGFKCRCKEILQRCKSQIIWKLNLCQRTYLKNSCFSALHDALFCSSLHVCSSTYSNTNQLCMTYIYT